MALDPNAKTVRRTKAAVGSLPAARWTNEVNPVEGGQAAPEGGRHRYRLQHRRGASSLSFEVPGLAYDDGDDHACAWFWFQLKPNYVEYVTDAFDTILSTSVDDQVVVQPMAAVQADHTTWRTRIAFASWSHARFLNGRVWYKKVSTAPRHHRRRKTRATSIEPGATAARLGSGEARLGEKRPFLGDPANPPDCVRHWRHGGEVSSLGS